MANSETHGILNVSPFRVTRFLLLNLIGIFAGFIFLIFSAGFASAAPTTVTGTITGIPDDSWGMAWGEKLVSGNWVEISTSYTKDLRKGAPYSVSLGEVSGSTVRIWAQFPEQIHSLLHQHR